MALLDYFAIVRVAGAEGASFVVNRRVSFVTFHLIHTISSFRFRVHCESL